LTKRLGGGFGSGVVDVRLGGHGRLFGVGARGSRPARGL
jgi:hypothetical protein